MDNQNQNQDTKTYLVAVPDSIQDLRAVPEDMGKFFELLLPNLKFQVSRQFRNLNDSEDYMHSFIEYFLGRSKKGDLRYLRYDSSYNVPYWKWVSRQMTMFIKSRSVGDLTHVSQNKVSIDTLFDDESDSAGSVVTEESLSRLMSFNEQAISYELEVTIEQTRNRLRIISEASNADFFSQNCLRVFDMRMSEMSTKEMAAELGITQGGVNQWVRKLMQVLSDIGFSRSMLKGL
jgi:DNA-binding CsgD family transcriptional regulator